MGQRKRKRQESGKDSKRKKNKGRDEVRQKIRDRWTSLRERCIKAREET